MVHSLQDFNFWVDAFSLLKIDYSRFFVDFDCHLFTSRLINCFSHTSISSSSQNFPYRILVYRPSVKSRFLSFRSNLWCEVSLNLSILLVLILNRFSHSKLIFQVLSRYFRVLILIIHWIMMLLRDLLWNLSLYQYFRVLFSFNGKLCLLKHLVIHSWLL